MYTHGALQMFALVAMLCGLGLGIKLAQMRSYVRIPSGSSTSTSGNVLDLLRALQGPIGPSMGPSQPTHLLLPFLSRFLQVYQV